MLGAKERHVRPLSDVGEIIEGFPEEVASEVGSKRLEGLSNMKHQRDWSVCRENFQTQGRFQVKMMLVEKAGTDAIIIPQ